MNGWVGIWLFIIAILLIVAVLVVPPTFALHAACERWGRAGAAIGFPLMFVVVIPAITIGFGWLCTATPFVTWFGLTP